MESGRRWSAGLLLLGAGMASLAIACEASGLSYVKSGDVEGSDAKLFMKLPKDWRLFDEDDLLPRQTSGLTPDQAEALRDRQWLMVFDADPDPSIDNLAPDADYPAGIAQIRRLGESETEYSPDSLRSEVFPYDELRFQDGFELIASEDLDDLPDRLEGDLLSYSFDLEGRAVRVAQMGAFDPDNRVIYLMVVACKESCFESEEDVIDRLLASWTVEGDL